MQPWDALEVMRLSAAKLQVGRAFCAMPTLMMGRKPVCLASLVLERFGPNLLSRPTWQHKYKHVAGSLPDMLRLMEAHYTGFSLWSTHFPACPALIAPHCLTGIPLHALHLPLLNEGELEADDGDNRLQVLKQEAAW